MNDLFFSRRNFIKDSAKIAAGTGVLSAFPSILQASTTKAAARIKFSVIAINHGHIYGMIKAVQNGGGELVAVYAKEPDLLAAFVKVYPTVKIAKTEAEILEDESIQLILSSGIPVERAPLGIKVMQHGKDFMVDKPGITSLKQLADVKKVQQETKRIYSIVYSEHFDNKATVKAGELVKAGAIGKVIQTIGLGPHRMTPKSRPEWFFDTKNFGGIITDIASHQFDQFIFFTGSTKADIVSSQVGNLYHPEYPNFEDFGDITLRGNHGMGYIRVDWFTPDGLDTWGDGRLTILGTEGFIEVRKNTDIAVHKGGNHLYLVTQKDTTYIDCNNVDLPYGRQLVDDVINRTETAIKQELCFLATELALKSQAKAQKIQLEK
jgi:predicted dehydrogenase